MGYVDETSIICGFGFFGDEKSNIIKNERLVAKGESREILREDGVAERSVPCFLLIVVWSHQAVSQRKASWCESVGRKEVSA